MHVKTVPSYCLLFEFIPIMGPPFRRGGIFRSIVTVVYQFLMYFSGIHNLGPPKQNISENKKQILEMTCYSNFEFKSDLKIE